jgi:hypothetical protein
MTKAIIIDAGDAAIQKVQDQMKCAGWAVDRVESIGQISEHNDIKLFVYVSDRAIQSSAALSLAEKFCVSSEVVVIVAEPMSVICVRPSADGPDPWMIETKRRCACLLQDMFNALFMEILRHCARMAGVDRLGYCARRNRRLF